MSEETGRRTEPTPYDRFEDLARKVLTTPKTDAEKQAAEKKQVEGKQK